MLNWVDYEKKFDDLRAWLTGTKVKLLLKLKIFLIKPSSQLYFVLVKNPELKHPGSIPVEKEQQHSSFKQEKVTFIPKYYGS